MILNKHRFLSILFLITTVSLILATGCTKKKKVNGKEFIPRDTLVEVLTDLHLMDGITNDTRFYHKFNPGDSIDMYSWVFEKYNLTRKKFDLTIKEYSKYPELLNQVYDEVLMQLNLKLEREEKVTEEDKNQNLTPGKKSQRKELPSS